MCLGNRVATLPTQLQVAFVTDAPGCRFSGWGSVFYFRNQIVGSERTGLGLVTVLVTEIPTLTERAHSVQFPSLTPKSSRPPRCPRWAQGLSKHT